MRTRSGMILGAAASLAVTPIAAQAASAPVSRSSGPVSQESEMGGGFGAALVIIAIAAAGMLFLILTDDEDEPVSA